MRRDTFSIDPRLPWAAARRLCLAHHWIGGVLVAAGVSLSLTPAPLFYAPVLNQFSETWLFLRVGDAQNPLIGLAIIVIGVAWVAAGVRDRAPDGPRQPEAIDLPRPVWVRPTVAAALTALLLWLLLLGGIVNLGLPWVGPEGATDSGLPLAWEIGLWLSALAFASLVVWRLAPRESGPIFSRGEWAALAAIVALGFALAGFRLGDQPRRVIGDEVGFLLMSKLIADGYTPSLFKFGLYSFGMLSSYWQALFITVLGADFASWRLSSIVPGVLTVIPLFGLTRDLFGRRLAGLAAVLYVSLPYLLAVERLGYNNSQSIAIVAGMVWCAQRGLARRSLVWLWAAGMLGGLGLYTYTAARLGWVIVDLAGVLLIAAHRRDRRALVALARAAVVIHVAGLLVAGPHLLWGVLHQPDALAHKSLESLFLNAFYAREFYSESELTTFAPLLLFQGQQLVVNPDITATLLARGVLRTLLAFTQSVGANEHYLAGPLPGAPLAALVLFIGLGVLIGRARTLRRALPVLWIGSAVTLLSMLNTAPPRALHLVPLLPMMALAMAFGLDVLCRVAIWLARPVWRNRLGAWQGLAACGALGLTVLGVLQYYAVGARLVNPDFEDAIHWTVRASPTPLTVVHVYDNPIFFDWKPYSIDLFGRGTTYFNVSIEDVAQRAADFPDTPNVAVFVRGQTGPDTISALQRIYPDLDQAYAITTAGGFTLGVVLARGNVVLPGDPPLGAALRSLVFSPAGYLAAGALALAVVLVTLRRRPPPEAARWLLPAGVGLAAGALLILVFGGVPALADSAGADGVAAGWATARGPWPWIALFVAPIVSAELGLVWHRRQQRAERVAT